MDKDRNEMTKRILHFTLEILHLLTGEDYTIVKKTWGECMAPSSHLHESGGRSRARGNITEPPPHSLIHEKKILELTHRITELLTREVPIRCQDVAVYFSMEEWEYIEGHKDLYQDIVMMEDHRPLTSQDGAIDRNPPERCPRPLYSQDCAEGNVPEKHQGENLMDIKFEVIDEPEEETNFQADQQYGVIDRNPPERCPRPLYSQDCPEGNVPEKHQGGDLTNNKVEDEEERMRGHNPCMREVKEEVPDVTPENPSKNSEGNFMLSVNDKGEDGEIMERSSGEDGEIMERSSGEDGEIMERSSGQDGEIMDRPSGQDGEIMDRPSGEDGEIMERSSGQDGEIMERSSGEYGEIMERSSGQDGEIMECCSGEDGKIMERSSGQDGEIMERCSGEDGKIMERPSGEDGEIMERPSGEDGGIMERSSGEDLLTPNVHPDLSDNNPPDHGEPSPHQPHIVTTRTEKKRIQCDECGKWFTKTAIYTHRRNHTGEKPYSCSECERCFLYRSELITHARSHTGEKPFPCSECGKCFLSKAQLVIHERNHTGEKPYSCSECGKCFTDKATCVRHETCHTGVKPYPCPICGKFFTRKSYLAVHERCHAGEKPHSCSECGKRFTDKSSLVRHERTHKRETPYLCSECGKYFTDKSSLIRHSRSHTGEKPYSCSECEKSFTRKSHLVIHKKSHTGVKPYSRSKCEKISS
ncbi:oocyte zinc finger protein XlCOF8.4-like [Hyla sarda]|uniref:oocyte zinc finger protein XlCOF8.4-like n=1 Tax=Hyla sarda TaxID=327740 RepID=UPI0024C262F9|nr:oocyte zinc finger protein XlCOF8.4-like [Hyla sarda]